MDHRAGGNCTPPRRSFFTAMKDRKIKGLERSANASPQNAALEVAFLRELGRSYPEAVIQRFESGRHQNNQEAVVEYLRACHALGRAAPAVEGPGAASLAASAGRGAEGDLAARFASHREPLNVRVIQGLPQAASSGAWATARYLGVAFLGLSMIGALLENQSSGGAGRLGANQAVHSAETSDKRFTDVMGCDEAKHELEETVAFLRNPDKFTRLGGKLPSGLLLMGPPGTGKTLLAKAIAGEAGVPFFYASGSEFEEMYVGVGARRMRDLFEAAKKRAPCIIFIDEIDAVGSSRQLKEQQAMKMTLNQLLVEMDGFEQNQGIIVIGATNYSDVLDDALLRPGRFDRHVVVPLPDVKGRRQILELYCSKVPLGSDVDLDVLSRGTPGMSGAELFNLVNQAALKAAADGLSSIDHAALEYSKDKILMGAERKSAVITAESAKLTAYHEGGHALVAMRTKGADPVHKATIMPRGQALGMVMQLPGQDQTSMSRRQMLARLDVCMGGRVAEELVFGEDAVTSGASSDIQQATNLARSMVMNWGMSDSVGVVFVTKNDTSISPEQRARIDVEVKKIHSASYERATKLLTSNRRELDRLAAALVERETLTGAEVADVIAGRVLAPAPAPKVK